MRIRQFCNWSTLQFAHLKWCWFGKCWLCSRYDKKLLKPWNFFQQLTTSSQSTPLFSPPNSIDNYFPASLYNLFLVSAGFLIACAACSYFIVYSFFLIWRYEEPVEVALDEDEKTREDRADSNLSKKQEFSSALWNQNCIWLHYLQQRSKYDCTLDWQNRLKTRLVQR